LRLLLVIDVMHREGKGDRGEGENEGGKGQRERE